MGGVISLWSSTGVIVIMVGSLLHSNPILVVIIVGVIAGLAVHMPVTITPEKLGKGFPSTRNLPFIPLIPLAVVGLSERHGLKERARARIAKIRSTTSGRLLIVYLFIRGAATTLGLTSPGGHPQMVRPLLAPMAEGVVEKNHGEISGAVRYRLRAVSTAADNVGLFFGEDIFVAFGMIIFVHNFILGSGEIQTEPPHIALWEIPAATRAFLIHDTRLWRLDDYL